MAKSYLNFWSPRPHVKYYVFQFMKITELLLWALNRAQDIVYHLYAHDVMFLRVAMLFFCSIQ